MIDILFLIITDAFWSALAAMGFALLFNVPRRALMYCMIAGALGHALRSLLMSQFGWSIELSTLMGATAIGFFAKFCAHRLKMPSMIFAISAVIPMVPGVYAYRTMIGILQITDINNPGAGEILLQSAVSAIKAGLILAALAGGIVAPSLIFQRQKPVV